LVFGFDKSFSLNNKKGTTLVELLVVIFIIALLSVVSAYSLKSSNSQLALQRAANKLAQDIRRAQEMTMSADLCKVAGCANTIPPRYGIFLNSLSSANSYEIRADMDNDGLFSQPNDGDVTIESLMIENNIQIRDYTFGNCTLRGVPQSPHGPAKLSVTYRPPDPVVEIWIGKEGQGAPNEPVSCDSVKLILGVGASGGSTSTVTINQAGLISVQ
jgi:prepilin-type N-terminal cleavage/methylation domain-containing protein